MNLHPQFIIDTSYFAAAFLFIYGLKRMSSPITARSGIMVAGIGMLVATLASFLYFFGVDDAARPHLTTNLALAAIAWSVHRFRLGQLSARFQAVLKERNRLAREMHDTLIQGCVSVSALLDVVPTSNTSVRQTTAFLMSPSY